MGRRYGAGSGTRVRHHPARGSGGRAAHRCVHAPPRLGTACDVSLPALRAGARLLLRSRAAGTNLAEQLLRRNLHPSIEVHAGLTAHKHWMQPPPNASAACGTLVLLTVRNPWDWANALFGICYCCKVRCKGAGAAQSGWAAATCGRGRARTHACTHARTQKFPRAQAMTRPPVFHEFVVKPYDTVPEHGESCEPDRDISYAPPRQFANVIAMRQASGERCHIVSRCVVLCLLWPTDYRSHRQCAGQD